MERERERRGSNNTHLSKAELSLSDYTRTLCFVIRPVKLRRRKKKRGIFCVVGVCIDSDTSATMNQPVSLDGWRERGDLSGK